MSRVKNFSFEFSYIVYFFACTFTQTQLFSDAIFMRAQLYDFNSRPTLSGPSL